MSEWRDIETAPKDGADVLVWDGDSVSLASYDKGTEAWWVLTEYTIDGVTHWQPLPEPPLNWERLKAKVDAWVDPTTVADK